MRRSDAMRRCSFGLYGLVLLSTVCSAAQLSAWAAYFAGDRPLQKTPAYRIRSDTKQARADLTGSWIGNTEQIRFDQDAMQINFDPARPFQWAPVWILDVSGDFYVLAVWNERYIVKLEGDTLTLTRAGYDGIRTFRRAALRRP